MYPMGFCFKQAFYRVECQNDFKFRGGLLDCFDSKMTV